MKMSSAYHLKLCNACFVRVDCELDHLCRRYSFDDCEENAPYERMHTSGFPTLCPKGSQRAVKAVTKTFTPGTQRHHCLSFAFLFGS